MSTLLYAGLSAQRQATDPGEKTVEKTVRYAGVGAPPQPPAAGDEEKSPAKKAGLGSYVDIVAALVPAEILVANAALLPLMTKTSDATGESVTTITEPQTLKVVFWLSIVSVIGLFLLGERTRAHKEAAEASEKAGDGKVVKPVPLGVANWIRALIPAGAYVAWVMLQKSTAFDAVWPGMEEAMRMTVAVFGAIGLAALAKVFIDKADEKKPPAPEPEPDPDPA